MNHTPRPRADTSALRNALPELVEKIAATHHLTFTMSPSTRQETLEDRIAEWVIRTNRDYLGRNWYRADRRPLRMAGLCFFERGRGGDNAHAHAIIRPPASADWLHFERHAPYLFGVSDRAGLLPIARPLTASGSLFVQRMVDAEADRRRVTRYDTKEMEFRPEAYADWKFIDDLARRGLA